MLSRSPILILVLFLSISGCARWEQPESRPRNVFPKSKISMDAVGLEMGIVRLDTAQSEAFEEFWQQLDQQALPLDLRKRLDQNGIRAAVMASRPPTVFHELVNDQPIVIENLNQLEKQLHENNLLRPKKRMIAHERISNREGQVHPVTVSNVHPQASWIVRAGEKQTVGSGKNASGIMALTTFPEGDGSVRLVIHPEIHHGSMRNQIGVAERSFLIQEGQAVSPIDDLKFEVSLRPGESIVVAPTRDLEGIGNLFFASIDGASEEQSEFTHRALMIRVVQTQIDDLFSDSHSIEKLTSTPRH